jgi:hypothetical protein
VKQRIYRILITVLVLVFVSGFAPALHAQAPSREYALKAAFLFNFIKFVRWPETAFETPGEPLSLCILGEDPFGDALKSLVDKEVHNRPLAVHTRAAAGSPSACQVVFISREESPDLASVLSQMAGKPVLTVGETPGFAEKGGVINFFTQDQKLRFEINMDAARNAGLEISSNLLKLARIVQTTHRRKE